MRYTVQIVCMVILCCVSFNSIAQNEDLTILDKKISIEFQEETIPVILEEISLTGGINFSYDPSIIDETKLLSGSYQDEELGLILWDILGDQFIIQAMEEQIIIKLPGKSETNEVIPDTPSEDILSISGEIADSKTKEKLPFASISILNNPLGTISNNDGQFEIKIPKEYQDSILVISSLGYSKILVDLDTLKQNNLHLEMVPVVIRLGEVVVSSVNPQTLLNKFDERFSENYPLKNRLMSSFYREVLLQDGKYINVSEALMEILKAPYNNMYSEDRVRLLKARKSSDVEPFKYVDFKMQGGPFYITKLDVVKTMYSFIDKEYRNFYKYTTEEMTDYSGRSTYVINFEPIGKTDFSSYEGTLYFDKETQALVYADFQLSKDGLKLAKDVLVKKKPKGFNVKPLSVHYIVSYKLNEGKWYIGSAQMTADFHVKSKDDNINSVFSSISDLLVTNHEETNIKRFLRDDMFVSTDIFTEMIIDYDNEFWGDFNTIKPNENLREAIENLNINTFIQ